MRARAAVVLLALVADCRRPPVAVAPAPVEVAPAAVVALEAPESSPASPASPARDILLLVDVTWSPGSVAVTGVAPVLVEHARVLAARDPSARVALVGFAGRPWSFDLATGGGGALDSASLFDDGYRGPVEAASPWRDATAVAAAPGPLAELQGCHVGPASWFGLYRHLPAGEDPEVAGLSGVHAYRVAAAGDDGGVRLALRPDEPADAFTLRMMDTWATATLPTCRRAQVTGEPCEHFTALARGGRALGRADQCMAWLAAESVFQAFDPRRAEAMATGRRSPLACHDGSVAEERKPSSLPGGPLVGQPCGFQGGDEGTPRYGRVEGERLVADPALGSAGARLDRGLEAAATALSGRLAPGPAQVVVVLRSVPGCGPWAADGGACDAAVVDASARSVEALVRDGVAVQVVALVDPGVAGTALTKAGATVRTVGLDELAGVLAAP